MASYSTDQTLTALDSHQLYESTAFFFVSHFKFHDPIVVIKVYKINEKKMRFSQFSHLG